MSPAASYAASAGLGLVLGAGAAAGAALATAALARWSRSVQGTMAIGAGMRLAGAAAGVTAGVLLGPPSVAMFVGAFLVIYLAAHAFLIFGKARRFV